MLIPLTSQQTKQLIQAVDSNLIEMPPVTLPKDMLPYHLIAIEVTTEEAGQLVDALATNADVYYELQVLLWEAWRKGLAKENGFE
jgi:hypothetical protein